MNQSNRKVLVIASSETLNILGSTGCHENGQPVNPLRMNCGEVELVSLVIEGYG